MVLESLISPLKAEKEPWHMFFVGMVYASISIIISLWVFEKMASTLSLLLTVAISIPIVYSTLRLEEKKDTLIEKETTLLKEHSRAISFFMYLFYGITLAYALWFIFLPQPTVDMIFKNQINTISNINEDVVTGNASLFPKSFFVIFFNNLRVLAICILFSFLLGAGSIFILTWNASIIATALGTFVRNNISDVASLAGLPKIAAYFSIFVTGIMRYSIHGIPEIASYFIAALAGGIISVAVIRHDFGTKKLEKIIVDVADLIAISVVLLFIAAVLEVFVSHAVF